MLTELEFLPSTISLRQAYNRYVEYKEDEGEEPQDFNEWAEEQL